MSDEKKDMTEKLLNISPEELEIDQENDLLELSKGDEEIFKELMTNEEIKKSLERTLKFKIEYEKTLKKIQNVIKEAQEALNCYFKTLENICAKLGLKPTQRLYTTANKIVKHIKTNNIDINQIDFTEVERKILEDLFNDISLDIEKTEKDLINLQSVVPKNFLIPNGKVHNHITEIAFAGIPCDVNVGTEKKKIYTKVLIDYKDKNVKLPSNFSPYDKVVFDAIVTLYEAGNKIFTTDMVFRCMNGLTNKEKPTPQQKGAITKSIEKMRFLHCEIDYTEEANARLKSKIPLDEFKIEGYFLNADKIMVAAGGRKVEAYQLNKKPLLYEYAQFSKQIINIPIQLLNTKEVVNATDEIIVIREYLLTRIENAKKGYLSNKITYQSIFEQINLIDDGSQYLKLKIKRLKAAIRKILELWKKEKYINDFKEYKEGRAIKGIEILF